MRQIGLTFSGQYDIQLDVMIDREHSPLAIIKSENGMQEFRLMFRNPQGGELVSLIITEIGRAGHECMVRSARNSMDEAWHE